MKKSVIRSSLLAAVAIVVTGCFSPTNTAEEVVSSYLESVKETDYKSMSLLLTKKHHAELETKKIACLGSTKSVLIEMQPFLNNYTREIEKCLADKSEDEKKLDAKNEKTHIKNNDKEGLYKLISKCTKNEDIANLTAQYMLAESNKNFTRTAQLEKEIGMIVMKTEIMPHLSPQSIAQCEKKVLIPKDMQKLNDGKILTVSTQNDAQKTITVEFTFARYKQKADFLVYLQDNTWSIESISFLEVENNLLGKFRCQEFTEDFSIRVRKGNKLDFYFDGNRFEYKTKLISPNEILVEFKKDKTETFRKTVEGTFIYNNTPCKSTF